MVISEDPFNSLWYKHHLIVNFTRIFVCILWRWKKNLTLFPMWHRHSLTQCWVLCYSSPHTPWAALSLYPCLTKCRHFTAWLLSFRLILLQNTNLRIPGLPCENPGYPQLQFLPWRGQEKPRSLFLSDHAQLFPTHPIMWPTISWRILVTAAI